MAKNDVFSRLRRLEESNRNEVDELLEHNEKNHDVHVLAVDDSLIDRKVIERLLKITSCRVTAVDSGKKALEFLGLDEEESPVGINGLKVDLVITDYCMPGMTGYELMKKIKGSSTFREIPVVIMSSENILARIHRCLEEGAEDFIVKPVKLSDVKRLKSYMFGEVRSVSERNGFNEGKLHEETSNDQLCSSSSSSSSSSSQDFGLTNQSPPFDSSPSSSPRSFSSLPSSPTSSNSPTR